MLTILARRLRGHLAQRLRGVSHLKNWGLYVKESVLSKLSRYETAMARSLYKALHELQRLQAARGADGNALHRLWR